MNDDNSSERTPKAPKTETYWEKTVRKCSKEPLVPIGGLATAAILMLVKHYFSTSKISAIASYENHLCISYARND
jgi:hypothetical protein